RATAPRGPGLNATFFHHSTIQGFRQSRFPAGRYFNARHRPAQISLANLLTANAGGRTEERKQLPFGDSWRQGFKVKKCHGSYRKLQPSANAESRMPRRQASRLQGSRDSRSILPVRFRLACDPCGGVISPANCLRQETVLGGYMRRKGVSGRWTGSGGTTTETD